MALEVGFEVGSFSASEVSRPVHVHDVDLGARPPAHHSEHGAKIDGWHRHKTRPRHAQDRPAGLRPLVLRECAKIDGWHGGRQVAHDDDATPERRERFRREARIAARLDHPAIVRIHDLLHEAGRARRE